MSELVGRTLELLAETKRGFVSAVKNIFNTRTMATLKISDLSVGDWVKVIEECLTISSIFDYGGSYSDEVALMRDGRPFAVSSISEIRSIPITAEILEKNGFVKWQGGLVLIGDEVSCRYEDGNLTIERGYLDNEGVLVERLLVNIECLYVHQLQHALRLAGVDKEINL